MKISTQNDVLLKRGYSLKEGVKILADAGFDCIDFSFFPPLDMKVLLNDKNINSEFYELRYFANGLGIEFNQAHAMFPSGSCDKEENEQMFRETVKSMELASILGAKYIVVHPKDHLSYKFNQKKLLKINREFYSSLIPYCEKYNIKVAIENLFTRKTRKNGVRYEKGVCSSPKEHALYVDSLNSPYIVACLDVGHSAIAGENPAEAIKILGRERLCCLHIQDVDYKNDNHLLPGLKKLDFDAIIKALYEIDYSGEFTLECDPFMFGFEKEFVPVAEEFMAKRARFILDKNK